MRTSPQQWLREGVNFKLSAVLCPEREAGGEMRASNAGKSKARAEPHRRGAVLAWLPRTPGEGAPLAVADARRGRCPSLRCEDSGVHGTEAASSSCEILALPQRCGPREAR